MSKGDNFFSDDDGFFDKSLDEKAQVKERLPVYAKDKTSAACPLWDGSDLPDSCIRDKLHGNNSELKWNAYDQSNKTLIDRGGASPYDGEAGSAAQPSEGSSTATAQPAPGKAAQNAQSGSGARKLLKTHKKQPASENDAQPKKEVSSNCRVSGDPSGKGRYSIQFHIKDNGGKDTKDADGNTIKSKECAGMYYSVYMEYDSKYLADLVTDEHGKTCVFNSYIGGKIYLYIGHRQEKWYDLPGTQSHPALISDEAPLAVATMDKDYELVEAPTQRLWKPWTFSKRGKEYQISAEGIITFPYLDSVGNATVGIGHLIHSDGFVMNDVLVNRVKNDLIEKGKPLTPENFQNDLQSVLALQGEALKNAKAEMEFVDGISVAKAKGLA